VRLGLRVSAYRSVGTYARQGQADNVWAMCAFLWQLKTLLGKGTAFCKATVSAILLKSI
jgi:hypothetical protein